MPEPALPSVSIVTSKQKPTLHSLFNSQQDSLFSEINHLLLANPLSSQSLEHTRLHLGILSSAAHFLTLNQDPLPSAIVFAIIRSCSLVTEQALTARALFEGFDTTHDQVLLAEQLALPVPTVLQALRQGVIFHRYPSTSELYLREHNRPTPHALQWLLSPGLADTSNLIELIKQTFAALKIVFPHLPESQDLENFFHSGEPAAPLSHPFCSRMTVDGVQAAYTRCEKLTETIDAMNGFDETFQPIKKAICKDIRFSLQWINSALECLAKFPQTLFLAAIGDATLTLLQFLDEHIEKLWHLHSFGIIRISHDLEDYRASRDYRENPEHERILVEFNIGYGAQYPHRYRHETGRSSTAIDWRLVTEKMSFKGQTLDEEALEFEKNQNAGFKTVKKKGTQTMTQHPVFSSHDRLFEFVSAEAAMAEQRLKELRKELARSSHNDRDHD